MGRNRPRVSIGMPVYNGERFIREALDSLLAQTFADFELIISDNASTDTTGSICRSYAEQDTRIRYIRQQENLGALPNFQFVLNEACGEYFMWAACDDLWDRDWIRQLCIGLEKRGGCALFGRLMQIDENASPMEHPAIHNSFHFAGGRLKRRVSFFVEFEGKGKANLFYSLFRRDALIEYDLAKYEADYLVLFDLLRNLEFVSAGNVFLSKRIHAECEGIEGARTISKRLLEVVTLQLLRRDFRVARSYLKYATKCERMILATLIPLKILNNHLWYAWRLLNKLTQLKLAK